MFKVPPKFYTTGEIACYFNISRQTVHNYSSIGLIRENKWSEGGGQRLYDESVFKEIILIRELNKSGYPLRAIKEIFIDNRITSEKGRQN